MIGLLTKSSEVELITMVRRVVTKSAPDVAFEVVNIERRRDADSLNSRDFLADVLNLDACILDCDVGSLVSYAAELGSLAAGLVSQFGQRSRRDATISDLDRRVLLITREPREHSDMARYFGDFYTLISLADVSKVEAEKAIANWLRDTLDRSTPKIFISYRSAQRVFAKKIAASLQRRGGAVWFDEIHIAPGDSIPDAINRGLGWCTHMVLLVDETFFDSEWTQAEYESVLYQRLSGGRVARYSRSPLSQRAIIPLYLVDPSSSKMPPMLARIRGIDCRVKSFRSVVNQLWNSVTTVGPR
ncbi:toll/interleukin-1 receptor domain-containing protein [Roseateles sp. P5_D6]